MTSSRVGLPAAAAWLCPSSCRPPPRQRARSPQRRRPSFAQRLLTFVQNRSHVQIPSPQKAAKPAATDEEWRELILEFEQRADDKYDPSTRPPPGKIGLVEEAQFESLPYVFCGAMTALTASLWFFGRILRLDAFLLLFYPLPSMYIASRFGLRFADLTLICSVFFIFTVMGPLYAGLYFLNTGLLVMVYARALWYRWDWKWTLLGGGVAKGVGLALQLAWVSVILRYNAWKAASIQVTAMLRFMGIFFNKIVRRSVFGEPGMAAVQTGLSVVVALHSFYHVFFTLVFISILLTRLRAKLVREPPAVPGVAWFLKRASRNGTKLP